MPSAAPLRTLLALAAPMVLARASQAVITFADALQVKHLGAGPIVAVSTGGINFYMFVMLPMGLAFIVQSFVSQLAGKGAHAEAPRYAWYGLGVAAIAAVVAATALPLVPWLLGFTGYSAHVQADMGDYIQIRILSVGAVIGIEALGNWYGGLGNTWMQMIAGLLTMTIAVACNWLLIDGHLGLPALGVSGAAWASVIASWAGFGFLALAFWRRWGGAPKRTAKLDLTRREFVRVVRFGLPNGLNWFLEFAAFQLFVNGVLSSLGDDTVAALNVVLAVNSISFMPAFGLASAGAILAGQAIGRGDKEAVWPQVKITLVCTGAWMGAIGALYFVAPHWVLTQFEEPGKSGNLVAVGTSMLAISALWQVFDAVNMTFSETLRAAGDTAWTMAARLILAWALFTPAAFTVVHFGGGPVGAMLCLVGYLFLLATALALRFRRGAWKKIELIEPTLV